MEYEVKGDLFPCLVLSMKEGDEISCDAGAMAWMTPGVKMSTGTSGGVLKSLQRMASGESFFVNKYRASGPALLSLTPKLIGTIESIKLNQGDNIIIQRQAMFVQETSIESSIYLQRNIFSGLLSGESFVLTSLKGNGMAWLEVDGRAIMYNLKEGQQLEISTGNFVAMDSTCSMNIVRVKGITNMLFGKEGLCNVLIKGPGRVWLQTGSSKEYILNTVLPIMKR